MKNKLAVILALGVSITCISAAEAPIKSGSDQQTSMEVTVYNSDLGLVKDTRQLMLPLGQGQLHFMDVASSVMPVTVKVRAVGITNGLHVLEQNYEYDLMSHEKVLDKYIGKTIKIINWNEYQDRQDIVEATLLSNEGQIYKISDEIYLGHPGTKVVPEIPENLISKPTLSWIYQNDFPDAQQIEVSYLTSGISWDADYVLLVSADDKIADLSGWVTVQNQSGASYENAQLKLVAGQVNRVQRAPGRNVLAKDLRYAEAAAQQEFGEQSFFEYHLYDLKRKTTIKNNQSKQISLLEASGISLEKEYVLMGNNGYFYQPMNYLLPKQPVQVYMKFVNSKTNHLGMPIPAGTVRLYKEDSAKSRQFIGEDRVAHTPLDEKIRLKIGEAFDVVAERKQIDFKQVTTRHTESEWEITLSNRKDENIKVTVLEPISGDWEILKSSHPAVPESAFTIRFDVSIPKQSQIKVNYRVVVKY